MGVYVDGFVCTIPRANMEKYREMADLAGKVWLEHGALEYVEAVADDVPDGEVTSFPLSVKLKEDEVVVFAYAVYESREKRDEVMKKVMEDPRLDMDMKDMPFGGKRMIWGGFRSFVQLSKGSS